MNKKIPFYLPIMLLLLVMITACNDEDEMAALLLYDDQGAQSATISFNIQHVESTPVNDLITQGIDVSVTNQNNESIYDVSIYLTNVTPSGYVDDFSEDGKFISFIEAGSTISPDEYWCYNCGETNEVYIGNFWINTYSWAGYGNNFEAEFDISFYHNGNYYSLQESKTFYAKK
ncbi:MAG: hypothetical protein ACOCYO_09185 [Bacteroidota bacterium]